MDDAFNELKSLERERNSLEESLPGNPGIKGCSSSFG